MSIVPSQWSFTNCQGPSLGGLFRGKPAADSVFQMVSIPTPFLRLAKIARMHLWILYGHEVRPLYYNAIVNKKNGGRRGRVV